MKIQNMKPFQKGWIYKKDKMLDEAFVEIDFRGDAPIAGYSLVREIVKNIDLAVGDNNRVYKTKSEAIRFQIKAREFEICWLKKILKENKSK